MAYPIIFDKEKAQEWLAAVADGRDIRCNDGRWAASDLITLAGVCLMGAMSHGPMRYQVDRTLYEKLPAEHREASDETFEKDLIAAIELSSQLAFSVRDGQYDESFEEVVKAIAYLDGDQKVVRPISGMKPTSGA